LRPHPLLLALLLVACGGSSAAGPPTTIRPATTVAPTTAPATTTTTSPTAADEAAIRKVLQGYHDAVLRIGRSPDPEDPALDLYLTGEMREGARQFWSDRRARGVITRPAVNSRRSFRVMFVHVSGDHATSRECVVDDGLQVAKASGRVIDASVVTTTMTTTALRVGPVWKLASRSGIEQKGAVQCG